MDKVSSKGDLVGDPQLSGRSGAATAGQGTPKLNSFVDVDIDMFNHLTMSMASKQSSACGNRPSQASLHQTSADQMNQNFDPPHQP
jgi:hypothetical protein